MMWRRKKFVIGGVVILMALGFLLFRGFMSGATYYFEVSELLAKRNSAGEWSGRPRLSTTKGSGDGAYVPYH